MRAANPEIIYVRGTGMGQRGTYGRRGWLRHGLRLGQQRHGLQDDEGRIEPLPQPAAFFDLQGANTIAGAIGFALFKRAKTGETSVVDVSLMHVGMWALSPDIVGAPYPGDVAAYGDRRPGRPTRSSTATPPRTTAGSISSASSRTGSGTNLHTAGPARPDHRRALHRLAGALREPWNAGRRARLGVHRADPRRAAGRSSTGFSGVWAPVLRPSELHSHPQVEVNGYLPPVTAHDGSDVPDRGGAGPLLGPHHGTVGAGTRAGPAHRGGPARGRLGLGGHQRRSVRGAGWAECPAVAGARVP